MSDWVDDIGLTPDEQARLDAVNRIFSSVGRGRERVSGDLSAALPTTSAREQTAEPFPEPSVASADGPHRLADAPPALRWGWRYAQDGLWQLVLEDVA